MLEWKSDGWKERKSCVICETTGVTVVPRQPRRCVEQSILAWLRLRCS